MRARWALLLALALPASSAWAQSTLGGDAMPEAKDLVRIHTSPLEIKAGESATVTLALTIAPRCHVNANPPALDYMIPTEVKLIGGPGLTIGHPVYPPAKHVKLSFEETALAVYDGEAEISVPIEVAGNAPGGARSLAGQLKFQACNDQVCLAPASVPFTIALTITGGAKAGAGATPESTTASAPAESTTVPQTGFSTAPPLGGAPPPKPTTTQGRLEDAMKRGGFAWLLALFVGGMLLNLTPCVFPMLGVTVSVFGARRNEPLPKVVTAATLYVLGIVVTYTTLGVIAGLTGGLFGSALQSSWVNVGLGVLLAVLSLSMFGLYEMQPPVWLMQRMGGANTASSLGIFVSGLAVGIIAAPCVGPFVVAVLALIAQRANVMFGMQTMFALSLGLGAPYLVLASFSNLLQRLPRSGEWMIWVKKVFGVILLSVGAFYVLVGLAVRLGAAGGADFGRALPRLPGRRRRETRFPPGADRTRRAGDPRRSPGDRARPQGRAAARTLRRRGTQGRLRRGQDGDGGLLRRLVRALPRAGAQHLHRRSRALAGALVRPVSGGSHPLRLPGG
jgi:thiol:disulfide interchange protein DsbD